MRNKGLGTMVWTLILAGAAQAETPAPAFIRPQRPIANIVSPSWGQDAVRDQAGEVEQIAARLNLRPGMTLADIGAGRGYDTLRLSRLLGPSGHIFAEDVKPDYLTALKASVATQGLSNVSIVVGQPGDPTLPPRSTDAAIMVHMYHEIQDPFSLLSRLAGAFKPGGRLGIEELDRPTQNHGTPPKLLTCELEAAGYRLLTLSPMKGDLGYFAVFAPPSAGRRPTVEEARQCVATAS